MTRASRRFGLAVALVTLLACQTMAQTDPLPSWNDGPARKAILTFVAKVIRQGGPDFVPPADRIAVFDNDGTLWAEQPAYFQLLFAMDRVRALAPKHPDWKTKQPFKAVLDGDIRALAASGEKGLLELVMATHANVTADEFAQIVKDWLATAKHPKRQPPIHRPRVPADA